MRNKNGKLTYFITLFFLGKVWPISYPLHLLMNAVGTERATPGLPRMNIIMLLVHIRIATNKCLELINSFSP